MHFAPEQKRPGIFRVPLRTYWPKTMDVNVDPVTGVDGLHPAYGSVFEKPECNFAPLERSPELLAALWRA
ncbi:hypothetical protein [Mycobacterium sp. UM_Kg1]|uniref:hypothetical protein n=1 Tax=Mycobacterium sp. UM_Kg1 TaxID=1545691 RepID=UPI00128DF321|nr:hypothetical protein [Mycobacterium sp. UM_Kg1]